MDSFIAACARNIFIYREKAADKSYDYTTRVMYDRAAARWEDWLINKANSLMQQES